MDEIKLTPDFKLESLLWLQLPVTEISEDFTLYDLFCLAQQIEQDFHVPMDICGMPALDRFVQQIEKDREDANDDLKYLELHWRLDYDTRVRDMTPEEKAEYVQNHSPDDILYSETQYWDNLEIGGISNLMDFSGRGRYTQKAIDSWAVLPETDEHLADDACTYGVQFTPVNDLKHLPIRLNAHVAMAKPWVHYAPTPEEQKLLRTGFTLKIDPTLWCFITSVFWELTFSGYTPEAIADQLDILNDSCKKAKEEMDKDEK